MHLLLQHQLLPFLCPVLLHTPIALQNSGTIVLLAHFLPSCCLCSPSTSACSLRPRRASWWACWTRTPCTRGSGWCCQSEWREALRVGALHLLLSMVDYRRFCLSVRQGAPACCAALLSSCCDSNKPCCVTAQRDKKHTATAFAQWHVCCTSLSRPSNRSLAPLMPQGGSAPAPHVRSSAHP